MIGIQKDCKKLVYSLKVDLDELVNCLEKHELLVNHKNQKQVEKTPSKETKEESNHEEESESVESVIKPSV